MSKQHKQITARPVGKDLIFGAKRRLGGLPVNAGGQWDSWLPDDDTVQNYATEPECCASAGTLHAVEMLARKVYDDNDLRSYRFLAKASGTTDGGNDPHVVCETLRHCGTTLAQDWPYTKEMNSWDKFYEDIPHNVETLALSFIAQYNFGHEYVAGDPDSMMQALEYSPLGAAVWAWDANSDGLFVRGGKNYDDHWVTIYGYEKGQYWKVFDSYDAKHKKLVWDFGFSCVKRYTLAKQVVDETAWGKFMQVLRNILNIPNRIGFKLGLVGATMPSLSDLAWGDPVAARHSCRVIMDAYNLSWKEKGLLCSVIAEESGFKNTAVNYNRRSDGTVASTDYGICQINDRYHVGAGLDFPSVEYLVAHPEQAVAFMIHMYQAGQLKLWCAYSNGGYLKHMPDGILQTK